MDVVSEKVINFFNHRASTTYQKGEAILNPNDEIIEVYYVKSGIVRLFTISKEGNETTFNLLKPQTYFPMFSVLTDTPNDYYFEAMTKTEILKVPKKEFLKFVRSEPEVLFDLTRRIVSGVNGLLLSIENLTSGKAQNRVSTMISILAKRFGKKINSSEVLIDLPLTHQQIANLVGLTRETTSLEMEKLSAQKLIKYVNRKVVVHQLEKIEENIAI